MRPWILCRTANSFGPQRRTISLYSRLAVLLAESAARAVTNVAETAALDLLIARGHHGEALQQLGFPQKVITAARSLAIVPTLQRGLVTASEARQMSFDDTLWLPLALFLQW